MKNFLTLGLVFLVVSCGPEEMNKVQITPNNWETRVADMEGLDSLEYGKSYLSVYSQIYSFSQSKKYNLTGMISLRNTSEADTLYLTKVQYYDTEGNMIRSYFDDPVFLSPMETVEIVINQGDISGGTGSNFIIEWKVPKGSPLPLFEGIMNSMQGTQGISFTTQAHRIK